MQNVVLIGCIGFAILLIACFNFINLTIALNIKRFREVGIKKVIGAQKSNIIFQHLGETFIINTFKPAYLNRSGQVISQYIKQGIKWRCTI